jgi:hypothetical protein
MRIYNPLPRPYPPSIFVNADAAGKTIIALVAHTVYSVLCRRYGFEIKY